MKTIFDKGVREELVGRIHLLNRECKPQWGKMNVYEMTKHCTIWDEWVLGTNNPEYKQDFLGVIFGRMALAGAVKDDRPMKKNMPAGRNFIVKGPKGDVEVQKKNWADRIKEYEHFSNTGFIHDFFGKMTLEQIGIFAYKHSDHHLRQFHV